jgi:hypothetical protein
MRKAAPAAFLFLYAFLKPGIAIGKENNNHSQAWLFRVEAGNLPTSEERTET